MIEGLPDDFDISRALLPEALRVFEAVTRRPPLPKILYHYTPAQGLLGILSSGGLWATSARYMNDASEISYGRQLVCRILREESQRIEQPVRDWIAHFAELVENLHETHETYVACFCESSDLLSQWRAYGSGRGFCLGFDAAALSKIDHASIFRVEYDPDTQQRAVLDTVKVHVEEFRAAISSRDTSRIPEISAGFSLLLTLWVVAFKHPSFAQEQEWRITPFVYDKIRVRSDQGWLRPYVELPLGQPESARMPLLKITHGPSPQPDLDKRALKLLLMATPYAQVAIEGSEVPLRV